jgi:hypothetical protein
LYRIHTPDVSPRNHQFPTNGDQSFHGTFETGTGSVDEKVESFLWIWQPANATDPRILVFLEHQYLPKDCQSLQPERSLDEKRRYMQAHYHPSRGEEN